MSHARRLNSCSRPLRGRIRRVVSSATWPLRMLLVAMMCATPALAFNVVVLDPGHGGVDGGTHWNGLLEKTLTLDVAKRVEALLRDDGVTTVMSRRSDKAVSLD